MGAQYKTAAMTARLACPKCKRIGSIMYECRPASPGYNPRARLIHKLSAGFVTVDFSSSHDARVECAECRIPASQR